MELADGDDLSALIDRGPLPLNEALPIARQIADALEAAHELGIVHVGVSGVTQALITPDRGTYVYTYQRYRSDLYRVTGLR